MISRTMPFNLVCKSSTIINFLSYNCCNDFSIYHIPWIFV